MRNNKVFILGGRSGTSLMLRLLVKPYNIRGWSKKNKGTREPKKTRVKIRKYYPKVPLSIFDDYEDDFQVVKLPHFDLIVDKIIKRYKNPVFIVMDRNTEDIMYSYRNTRFSNKKFSGGFVGWANNEMAKGPGIKKAMEEFAGRKIKNDDDGFRIWVDMCKQKREEFLKNYPKELIFRIEFDDFMENFHKVMHRLCEFLGLKPKPNQWDKLRRHRWSPSSKGIKSYIK